MQKRLAYNGQALAKNQFKEIVPQAPTKNQVVFEISSYIQNGALTNALDLLEKRGIEGNLAVFILANLQSLEVTP